MKPLVFPNALYAYGSASAIFSMRTSSTSPGSAPSTWMGPVRMCPPGPLSVTLSTIARSAGSTSTGRTPAPSRRLGVEVSSVPTTTWSPDAMCSTGLASDQ